MDDFDMLSAPQGSTGNGVGADEDPAAAFLAQQESEIAGIENDEGFSILDSGEVPSSLSQDPDGGALNGDLHGESNGPSDVYVAISNADRLQAEPESLRKWREEQQERLEQLDANSRKQEAEWKENAKLELEEWHTRQNEQLEKTKVNNRYTTLFEQLKSIRGLVSASCCLIRKALESTWLLFCTASCILAQVQRENLKIIHTTQVHLLTSREASKAVCPSNQAI
uniref:Clathrin light chain n=1 Tax=Cyprinus carpio carpio TaxID=630221 RepID=A0A9J7ZR54_CYPCA